MKGAVLLEGAPGLSLNSVQMTGSTLPTSCSTLPDPPTTADANGGALHRKVRAVGLGTLSGPVPYQHQVLC